MKKNDLNKNVTLHLISMSSNDSAKYLPSIYSQLSSDIKRIDIQNFGPEGFKRNKRKINIKQKNAVYVQYCALTKKNQILLPRNNI